MHLDLVPVKKAKIGAHERRRPKTGIASVYKIEDEVEI